MTTTYISVDDAPREIVRRRAAEARAYLDRLPAWWPRAVAVAAMLLIILAFGADGSIIFAGIRSSLEGSDGKVMWLLALPIIAVAGMVAVFVKLALQKAPVEVEAVIAIGIAIWALTSLYDLGSMSFAHAAASASESVPASSPDPTNPLAENEPTVINNIPSGTYGSFAIAMVFLAALLWSLTQRAINQIHQQGRALSFIEQTNRLAALEQEIEQLRVLQKRLPEIEVASLRMVAEKALDLYSREISFRREEAVQMLDYQIPKGFFSRFQFLQHRPHRSAYIPNPRDVIARADRCLEGALQMRRLLAQGGI